MSGENEAAPAAPSVEKFLEKIARERDAAILRIRDEIRAAGAALRRQARHESRLVLHAAAARARAQARMERSRHISGLQARLRQGQWRQLQDWVQAGVAAVMNDLGARWRDRRRQWEWAEYWLRAAAERAGELPLRVACDAETDDMTLHRIEKFLAARAAGGEVRRSPQIGPGLKIEWGAYLLDGTLAAQREAIESALLARLARLSHESCA